MMPPTIPGDEAYDPCDAYMKMRAALQSIVSGEGVRRVRFRNGDEERETEFSQANVGELRKAMLQAQRECMEKTNGRPARHAIGIGQQQPIRRIY